MIDNIYKAVLSPYKLKGSMLSVLFVIGKNRGISQKKLATVLVLDQSTVSRDIKKLQTQGRLQITKGLDSRETILELTTLGYQLVNEIAPIWSNMHHKMDNYLGENRIEQIDDIIKAVQNFKLNNK